MAYKQVHVNSARELRELPRLVYLIGLKARAKSIGASLTREITCLVRKISGPGETRKERDIGIGIVCAYTPGERLYVPSIPSVSSRRTYLRDLWVHK